MKRFACRYLHKYLYEKVHFTISVLCVLSTITAVCFRSFQDTRPGSRLFSFWSVFDKCATASVWSIFCQYIGYFSKERERVRAMVNSPQASCSCSIIKYCFVDRNKSQPNLPISDRLKGTAWANSSRSICICNKKYVLDISNDTGIDCR